MYNFAGFISFHFGMNLVICKLKAFFAHSHTIISFKLTEYLIVLHHDSSCLN